MGIAVAACAAASSLSHLLRTRRSGAGDVGEVDLGRRLGLSRRESRGFEECSLFGTLFFLILLPALFLLIFDLVLFLLGFFSPLLLLLLLVLVDDDVGGVIFLVALTEVFLFEASFVSLPSCPLRAGGALLFVAGISGPLGTAVAAGFKELLAEVSSASSSRSSASS